MATYTNVLVYSNGGAQRFNSGDVLDLPGNFSAAAIESIGDMVVGGNLTVTGNITSASSTTVALGDAFIDLLASNTVTASAKAGGFTVNVQAITGTPVVPVSFTPVTGGSNAFITTVANPVGVVAVNDIIQVSGTTDGENDGIYVVAAVSAAPNKVEVKQVSALTTAQVPFVNTNFKTQTSGGAVVKANFSVVAASDGAISNGAGPIPQGTLAWAYGSTVSAFTNGWTSLAAATVTLQAAYDNGPSITLTNGNDLAVNAPSVGTAAVSLNANKDSNFSVTGGTLTLASDVRIDLDGAPVKFDAAGVIAATTTGLSAGDVVYIGGGGAAVASINDAVSFDGREVDGVVVSDGSSSNFIATVQGTIAYTAFDAPPGLGDMAYLSDTSGKATVTLPSTAGQRVYRLGRVVSTTPVGSLYPIKLQLQYIADL